MSPLRILAVILGGLVVQVCFLSRFSFEGARPDAMVLLAVLAGFMMGRDDGAIVGFAAGLALDGLLNTPLGLSALVYCVVAYVVGSVTGGLVRSAWWMASAVAAVGSVGAMIVYGLVGEVLGLATLSGGDIVAIVVVVSATNAALAPLAERALRWSRVDDGRARQPFTPR